MFDKFNRRLTYFRLISQYQGQCDRKVSPLEESYLHLQACLQKSNLRLVMLKTFTCTICHAKEITSYNLSALH